MIQVGLGTIYLSGVVGEQFTPKSYMWVVEGTLDFTVPSLEVWAFAADWLVVGALDFSAPIAAGDWVTPEGTPYTTINYQEIIS